KNIEPRGELGFELEEEHEQGEEGRAKIHHLLR
ncbi:hypothetical protein A2U01_0101754, partial [Trifolium medium]|nr:hypothetical protein [Trifolium medium]